MEKLTFWHCLRKTLLISNILNKSTLTYQNFDEITFFFRQVTIKGRL